MNARWISTAESRLNMHVSGPIPQGGGTQYDITGGTRPGGGANVFHSFGTFNVPNGNIANFVNETGQPTANILGRVNGGSPSNIFGTLQTTGFGNANLFLMNPAGVVFGPNASLNVGGSVTVTTADYIKLAGGARFQAVGTPAANGVLSAAPVAAFGFLGSAPQAIQVQGSQLAVGDGQNLALVGGNILLTGGTITAPSGQVTLVGVGRPAQLQRGGEVVIAGTGLGYQPTGFQSLGTVQLIQGASLQAGEPLGEIPPVGGTVLIRGGHFVMTDATIIVGDGPRAGGSNGAVEVTADRMAISKSRIEILGTEFHRVPGRLITLASRGDLDIHQSHLGSSGDGQTYGAAVDLQAGGRLHLSETTIDATQAIGGRITLVGRDIQITKGLLTTGGAGGDGGPIRLTAQRSINLDNTTLDASSFSGAGGTIEIRAGNQVMSQQSRIFAVTGGDVGGAVQVEARNIALKSTQVATGLQGFQQLRAGEITLTGTNIRLDNSQLSSGTQFGPQGGTIRVNGNNVVLNNSELDTSAVPFDTIPGAPVPSGGTITVTARNLRLNNSHLRSTAIDGQGGNIHITSRALQQDARSTLDVSSQFGTNGTILIERR